MQLQLSNSGSFTRNRMQLGEKECRIPLHIILHVPTDDFANFSWFDFVDFCNWLNLFKNKIFSVKQNNCRRNCEFYARAK